MSVLKVSAINNAAAGSGGLAISSSGLVTGAGMDLIVSQSFSAVSSASVDDCFTSDYDNYRVVIRSNAGISFRYRAGGVDNSASSYVEQYLSAAASSSGVGRPAAGTSHIVSSSGTTRIVMDVFSPALAEPTTVLCSSQEGGATTILVSHAYHHNVSSAFDGISVLGTSMTGTLRVYGYRN